MVVSEDLGLEEFSSSVLQRVVEALGVEPSQAIYVGAHPNREISAANETGLISVRLRKGESKLEKDSESQPRYEIRRLSEILQLVQKP